jgi:hypothetical protein
MVFKKNQDPTEFVTKILRYVKQLKKIDYKEKKGSMSLKDRQYEIKEDFGKMEIKKNFYSSDDDRFRNFNYVSFDNLDLSKLTFNELDFRGATFVKTHLSSCKFVDCKLFDACFFIDTSFKNVVFENCNLQGVVFSITKESKKGLKFQNCENVPTDFINDNKTIDENLRNRYIQDCFIPDEKIITEEFKANIKKFFPNFHFSEGISSEYSFDDINERPSDIFINLTSKGKNCIFFNLNRLNGRRRVYVEHLDKCPDGQGKENLKNLEKFAETLPEEFQFIDLQDASQLKFCDGSVKIDLWLLFLLSEGETWYNSMGYHSQFDLDGTNQQKQKEINLEKLQTVLKDFFKAKETLPVYATFCAQLRVFLQNLFSNKTDIEALTIQETFRKIKKYLLDHKDDCKDESFLNNLEIIKTFMFSIDNDLYLRYDSDVRKYIKRSKPQKSQQNGGKKTKNKRNYLSKTLKK